MDEDRHSAQHHITSKQHTLIDTRAPIENHSSRNPNPRSGLFIAPILKQKSSTAFYSIFRYPLSPTPLYPYIQANHRTQTSYRLKQVHTFLQQPIPVPALYSSPWSFEAAARRRRRDVRGSARRGVQGFSMCVLGAVSAVGVKWEPGMWWVEEIDGL